MAQPEQQGDETILEEAKNLLVQGKRFMALEDCQSATDCLERSCQLFDAFYGVAKRECADAYFEYGLALVALANFEAGSGTDKLLKRAGIEEEDDDDDEEGEEGELEDEEDGEEEEGEEKAAESEKETDSKIAETEQNGKEVTKSANQKDEVPMDSSSLETTTKTNGHQVTQSDQAPGASSSAPKSTPNTVEPKAGTSSGLTRGGDGDGDADGEDVENEEATTIEIAWEVLCLAKRLFMTDESLEGRLKLAETLQKIGEISIEWDNNDNAVSILEECLNIRQAILKPDDRLLALTYYHLGLAHSFKSETPKANENFQKAISVIEQRIESLNKDLEKAVSLEDTLAQSAYQKEISELKDLLPDMTMRLDDSKEDGLKNSEALKRTREEMQQEDEEAKKVCLDTSKPVDDISHLVKRKTN